MGKKKKRRSFSSVRIIQGRGCYFLSLDDEVTVPVTDWLDDEGEDCAQEDAVACVGGADGFGWVTVMIHHIERSH